MLYRHMISTILMLVIFPSISAVAVFPQQVTMTSTASFTTVMSSTSYGASTIGTYYVTSIQKQQQPLYSGSFTIAAPPGYNKLVSLFGCFYANRPFTAALGDHITGSFSSDVPVDVYVMDEASFHSGVMAYCDSPRNCVCTEFSQMGATSLSLDITINNPGKYEFLFMRDARRDNILTANITFSAGIVGGTTTMTSTLYSTTPVTQTQVITSTGSSLMTQTMQSLALDNSTLPLVVVAALVLVGVIAFLMYRKRSTHGPKTAKTVEKPTTLSSKTEMFCKKCGSKIPRDSTLCKECGTKITG